MKAGPVDGLEGALAPAENMRLFGQKEAEIFLAQSYRSGKSHHAILLEGPEGIGKATLAFRFANHVLSHPEPKQAPLQMPDPDPASPVSRQIASGASHNLLYMTRPVDEKTGKTKTAITVDEVRRVGKFFAQTSGSGNWRIAIIDPADDLNRNAANALLKILEEPPKRSMLLVISHAPGRLLATIRSRCLTVKLNPLDDDALTQALKHLGSPPSTVIRDRVLAAANGSVLEALKLIHHGGLDITDAFHRILAGEGPAMRKDMHKLADVLAARDNETVFVFFTALAESHVIARARNAALSGDLVLADRFARLSSRLSERLATASAYNLDRKQTILTLLDDIRDAGQKA